MKYLNQHYKYNKEQRILIRVLKDNDYLKIFLNDVDKLLTLSTYYKNLGRKGFIKHYTPETLISWFSWNNNSLDIATYNRSKICDKLTFDYIHYREKVGT
ncbi:MAG: hypothetical protein MJ221_04340 [Bacilli bacterium]|nr:hypothetical protein [Bacilli bacterium]